MAKFEGGCRCGNISFKIDDEPKFQVICQCSRCQQITGSGHAGIMIFSERTFMIEGVPATHNYVSAAGNTVTHHFCDACGGPLFNRNSKFDNAVYVLVGSLKDASSFAPQRVIYTNEAQPWDHVNPDLPSFPAMPTR